MRPAAPGLRHGVAAVALLLLCCPPAAARDVLMGPRVRAARCLPGPSEGTGLLQVRVSGDVSVTQVLAHCRRTGEVSYQRQAMVPVDADLYQAVEIDNKE